MRLRIPLLIGHWLIAVLFAAGCERSYGRQACRMEHEVLLAQTAGVPQAVAVVPVDGGDYLAVWSADGETRAVRFDRKGSAVRHPRRIPRRVVPGDPLPLSTAGATAENDDEDGRLKSFWPTREKPSIDTEDIAAVPLDRGRVALFLLEQSSSIGFGAAYLAIVEKDGTISRLIRLGVAGEYADRIAAAAGDDGLWAAWHDGMMGASRIRMVRINPKTFSVEARATHGGAKASASPTLAAKDGVVTMVWSETAGKTAGAKSAVKSAVLKRDLSFASERALAESRFVHPSPSLTASEEGLAVVFRDDEDEDDTPEYHFIPLSNTGAPTGERQRISTADGLKGPRIASGDNGYVGVTIRSFQRNLLIGLNRLDRLGQKLGGEFQVYADKSDFVRVDIAEAAGEVMIVYAEDRQNKGRILAGAVVCAPRK